MHRLVTTEDNSVTLYVPGLNEHYHSIHGAIQESRHIFIRAGMDYFLENRPDDITAPAPLHILEAGFGTGLNAYLTLVRASEQQIPVHYHTIEKYPLSPDEISCLNYPEHIDFKEKHLFEQLHQCPWESEQAITPCFSLCKHRTDIRDIAFPQQFDIVYFDAFSPEVQPHLWTPEVFTRLHQALRPGGILVTYCVKGIVKQALRASGFTLKRLPGPPGKREMLRATSISNFQATDKP